MLEHLISYPRPPERVVILGAGGFVGGSTAKGLVRDGITVLPLTRKELNLLDKEADSKLAGMLKPEDSFVVISAVAPCKTNNMLMENITMMAAVCSALEKSPVGHVIYISSDAVYADDMRPLTEESCAEPASLHGAMHLTRELMLRNSCGVPIAMLRPTLIYGSADPHNGYGPNRFRRLAAEGKDIILFGEGEESRDHVLIDDVVEIVRLVLLHRSIGILNIATGRVYSFREIAKMVATHFDPSPAIRTTPRQGSMPHNGYRAFDSAACRKAFPLFRYTPLAEGIAKVHKDVVEKNNG